MGVPVKNRILIGGALISAIASTSLAQYTRVLGFERDDPYTPKLVASRVVSLSSTQVLSLVTDDFGVTRLQASTYASGNWQAPVTLARTDAAIFGGPSDFTGFASLSLSPGTGTPLVSFVGSDSDGARGVYQIGFDQSNPTRIARSGELFNGVIPSLGADLTIGSNSMGAVVFGAGVGGGRDVLWRYEGTTTVLADTVATNPQSLTAFNPTDAYPRHRVVTNTGSVVGFAKDGSTGAIYEFTALSSSVSGASPRVAASGTIIDGENFLPVQSLGATAGGTGRTLYIGVSGADEARVIYQDGAGISTSMGGKFDASYAASTNPVLPSGTMTAGGRAVVYVPRDELGDDGTLHYYSSTAPSVQTIGPGAVVGSFTLATIGADFGGNGVQPAINEAGWVIFDATSDGGQDMLIAWNPEQGNARIVLAYVGQTFSFEGDATQYTIEEIIVSGSAEFDTDVFKDRLSEDGIVGFGVVYKDQAGNLHDAVVVRPIPEPAGFALVVGAVGLLVRRRRGGRSGSARGATADLA